MTTASPGGWLISAALELVTVFHWLHDSRPTYFLIRTSTQLILTVPHLSFSRRARAWSSNQKKKFLAIFLHLTIANFPPTNSCTRHCAPSQFARRTILWKALRGPTQLLNMPLFVLSETSAGYVQRLCARDKKIWLWRRLTFCAAMPCSKPRTRSSSTTTIWLLVSSPLIRSTASAFYLPELTNDSTAQNAI